MNRLDFNTIKAAHEEARLMGSDLGNLSLKDFSDFMQEGDPENDWSMGHSPDNVVGSISRGIDTGLKATGLPDLASNVTGFIGQGADALAGRADQHYEQIARDVGQGLPRMAADVGLIMGGAALTGASGGLAAPAGIGMIGAGIADAGAKGYTDSGGSVLQGATSAALMGLAPGIGSAGAKLGLSTLGKVAPKAAYSGAARVAAATVGEQGAFLGAMSVEQAINGHNPFTVDNMFANAVGMAAFTPLMIQQGARIYRDTPAKPLATSRDPEGLIATQRASRFVEKNDVVQLGDYLMGKPGATLPKSFDNSNLAEVLKLTGLRDLPEDPGLYGDTLSRREKGKQLALKAADVDDPTRLIELSAKLLETNPVNLVDTIQMVRALNKFRSKWEAEHPPIAGLLPQPAPTFDLIPHPTAKTKQQAMEAEFNRGAVSRPVGKPRAVVRDPNTIEVGPSGQDYVGLGKPSTQYDSLGVRVADAGEIRGVDAGIAQLLEDVNSAGFKTFQSMSGFERDYFGSNRGSEGEGYLSFLKSDLTEMQQEHLIAAAKRAGVYVDDLSLTYFMPSIVVRFGTKWASGKQEHTMRGEADQIAVDNLIKKGVLKPEDLSINTSRITSQRPDTVALPWGKNTFMTFLKERDRVLERQFGHKEVTKKSEQEVAADWMRFKAALLDGPFPGEAAPRRPAAVKGKPADLGARLRVPEFSRRTNPLSDSEVFRFTRVGSDPTGRDSNGYYTTRSLKLELERLNQIEATPDMAQARLTQKLKNALSQEVSQTPLTMMEKVFDNLGLDPKLKAHWMAAAQRVADIVHRPQFRYANTEAMEGTYGGAVVAKDLRGAWFPEEKLVTVTRSRLRNKEMEAFDALATLAHESTHGLLDLVRADAEAGIDNFRIQHAREAMGYAEKLTPTERYMLLTDVFDKLIPDQLQAKGKNAYIREWADYASKDPTEFLVEYGSALVLSKASAPVKRNFLRFAPEPIQNFMRAVFRGIDELKKMVFATAEGVGFTGGKEGLSKFINDMEMLYSKDPVLEGMKQSMVDNLQGSAAIERGDIGGLGVQFRKVGIKALDEKVQEHLKVRQSSGFVRNVMQHAQISAGAFYREHFPAYQKLVGSLTTMDGLAVFIQHAIRRNFMIPVEGGLLKELASVSDRKLTPQQIQQKSTLHRVQSSKKLSRAAFDSMLRTNELVRKAADEGGAYPTFDSPEIQAIFKDLTPNEIADIRQVYEAYLDANRTAADMQVKSEVLRMQYVAADYLLGAGIPHESAYNLGVRLFDAMLSGDVRNIPKEIATNEGALAFIKHWENVKDKFDAFRQKLDRPYFTEFRSGRYGVRYEVLDDKGAVVDTGYRSTNDKYQWRAIQRDVARDPRNRVIELKDHHKDPKGRFGQMQTRGLEEATNLVRAHYEAAMQNMKPELAALLDDMGFDPARPLIEAQNAELKTLAERRFAPGREEINMIAAQDAYSSLIARKLANTETRLHTNWLMKHESWNQDALLKQEVQQFRDNVLSAGRQEFQTFRKITTLLTMGVNVSSAIVDSTQPITMGVWRAAQQIGTARALKYTIEGFREAFKPLDKISDPVFKSILVEAINRGYLKTGGSLDNFLSADDTMNYNVLKAQSNRDLVDMHEMLTDSEFLAHRVFEQFSKLGQKTMEYSMMPMRLSAQLNNKNSLWVGYKMGLEKGLKGQELFDAAVSNMQTVNLQGMRAAHSSFKMKAGQASGLVEAATLMTNYPIAVFAEMVSSWQGMLKSSGLDAATRRKSAQAFAGQVLTQMAFAGVAGMGLKGVFAFAKEMFGLDAEEAIRQGAAAIDESGTLGEVLLNGVVNSITGVDVASRFDLSGLGGFNPYTGFDAKGLFGAGGGVFTALYNAPGQFARGDASKIQLIPTGIRRMATAWGEGAYQDSTGQQIINPTVTERFGQMLGFKPARMARILEQKASMRELDRMASDDNTNRKAQLIALMNEGKVLEVQQAIMDDVLAEMQGPEYTEYNSRELRELQKKLVREKSLELVTYGVEKLLPFDPLSKGSGSTAQLKNQVAAGFGTNYAPPRTSEATRVAVKQQMMQQLGLRLPRNAPRAIRTAQMVDEIIRENPTLTRSQALSILHGRE